MVNRTDSDLLGTARMDVFAIGVAPNYQLWTMYWTMDTGYSGWIELGGSWETVYPPTALTWGQDRIDVFLVDPNTKSLYHRYFDGNYWQPPASFNDLGGYCTSRPVAVSRGPGFIDVFARGGDAGLWHLSYTSQNGWSDWVSVDSATQINAEPEAVSWGVGNNIDVFAWGEDNALLHKTLSVKNGVTNWAPSTGYDNWGGTLAGPPKAVCDGADRVHAFAYLQNGQLGHRSFNHTLGTIYPSEGFEILGFI
jgi:hypothetical protein